MRPRYSFSSRKTGRAREGKNLRKQKGKYPLLAQKIIDNSDIILEILDARFIEETRNPEIEKEIQKQGKKLIYVLNKADISQKVKTKGKLHPKVLTSCTERTGVKSLRDLIKKESKKIRKKSKKINEPKENKEETEKVVVGVIGYPNTGKSSLINILIGKKSAGTGSDAGFTKGLQKLKLDSNIVLIDSPGVIPQKEYSGTKVGALSKHTIVGARSHSQVKYPEMIIANIFKEYPELLQKHYNIETKSSEHLIEKLGRKLNILQKGNHVNFDKVSRKILKDWQEGKIKV